MKATLFIFAACAAFVTAAMGGEPQVLGNVVGRPSDIDLTDERVIDVANRGLDKFNTESNSAYKHTLARIVEAKKQLVAGVKYTVKIEVEPQCGDACPETVQPKTLIIVAVHQAWQRAKNPDREWQITVRPVSA